MMVDADLDLVAAKLRADREPDAVHVITVLAGGVGAARLLAGLRAGRRPGRGHRDRQRRRRRRAARPATSAPTSTRHLHAGRRHRPRDRAGAWPARRGRPWTRSRRYGGDRPGSTSATATSAPTCTAPQRLRRGRHPHRGHRRDRRGLGPRAAAAAGDRRPAADHGHRRRTRARSGSRSTSCSASTTVAVDGGALRRRRARRARRPACSTRSPTPTSWSSPRRTRSCRSARCWPCPACATRSIARRDRRGRRVADRRRRRAEGPGRPAAARARPRGVGGRRGPPLRRRWPRTLVIDEADADLADAVEAEGMRCVVAPRSCRPRARPPRSAAPCLDAVGGAADEPARGVRHRGHRRDPPGRRPGRPHRRPRPRDGTPLADGDVVVVTQKVVSKAEDRLVADRPRRPARPQAARRGRVGAHPAPPRRPHHQRDQARLRVRQRRHRPVERRAGLRRPAARGQRPLGPPHPRRHPGQGRRRGRRSSSPTPSAAPGAGASPTWPSAAPASPPSSTCGAPTDALGPRAAGHRGGRRRRARRRRRAGHGQGRPASRSPSCAASTRPGSATAGPRRDRPPPRRGPVPLTARPRLERRAAPAGAEPSSDGGGAGARSVHGFQPRWSAGPARVERARGPARRAGPARGRPARSTPAAAAMAA